MTAQYYWKNASKVYSPTQHLLHSTILLFSANFFIYPHSTSFLPPLSSCFRQMSFSYLWSQGTASLWPQIWVELFKQLMNQSPVNIMYNKEKSINWPNSITPKKGACCRQLLIWQLDRSVPTRVFLDNSLAKITLQKADISGWFRLQCARDFLTQSETIIQNTFPERPIKGDYSNHGTSFRTNSWDLICRWHL